MHNRILTLLFLIPGLWTSNACSQTTFDNRLVSTDKELNFAFTDKRGITGDDGTVYFVEKDGRTLTAYADNEVKWTVNVIAICGEPAIGKPEIRYLELTNDTIQIVFGKHDFASVDIRDGKTKYLGQTKITGTNTAPSCFRQ